MANRFREYRIAKTALALLLVCYVGIAVGGNLVARHGEVFPVFSRSLFTRANAVEYRVEVWITALDGEALDPHRSYFEMADTFPGAARRDGTVNKLAGMVARAVAQGRDPARAARAIQQGYLRPGVAWKVVELVFRPTERYRTGIVQSERVVFRSDVPADPA